MRSIEIDLTDTGLDAVAVGGELVIDGDITASLWRAPTDNDGVSQGWMAEAKGVRLDWLRWQTKISF